MSLREIIETVESREKRLTVFDPPSREVVRQLREYFESQTVQIEVGTTDSSLSGYAVLSDSDAGGEVLAAVDLGHLGDPTDEQDASPFAPIIEHLDDTTFTSYDLRQMMAASREVEDRAWRKGVGTLHTGFQRVGAIEQQSDVYADLSGKSLDIHAYSAPAPEIPDIDGVTLHQEDTREIAESWFVVFDGDGDPLDACALLAEERGDTEERLFYGFWTYDPEIVDDILAHLDGRYTITV
ncbi:MAG: putative sensor protein/domain protein [halophilic archaeon J07HB67]|jgi:Predicted sensor protein/domain|nr:MAG: putative sensor protein/domain protein [halophilic archaeon J07HB67]